MQPCCRDIWPANGLNIDVDEERLQATRPFSECPICKQIARPNIHMFNDGDWLSDRTQKQKALYSQWLGSVSKLVVIELGVGQAIPTVRWACEFAGGVLVRINPREYQTRHGGISIPLPAKEALEIVERLIGE